MRLPIDVTQWGVLIIRSLVQQMPTIEPYIQLCHVLNVDQEGNGYGLVPLQNSFVPFVVVGFDLKPLDVLVVIEGTEQRWMNLTEPNTVMAVGGFTMGEGVAKEPVGVDQDYMIDMMPPFDQFTNGNRSSGRPDAYSSTRSVKLGSADNVQAANPATAEAFFKIANEHGLGEYLARRYQKGLQATLDMTKRAAFAFEETVILDPCDKGVRVYVGGNERPIFTTKQAAQFLRAAGQPDDSIADLMKGDLIAVDFGVQKRASAFGPVTSGFVHTFDSARAAKHPALITEPGWYRIDNGDYRVFNTTQLDGSPCSFKLGVSPNGYRMSRMDFGVPMHAPNSTLVHQFFTPAKMMAGEFCFMINEHTGEATVPFKVTGSTKVQDAIHLHVDPVMGDPNQTLSFGHNRHCYRLSPHEIALPLKGFSVYKLSPRKIAFIDAPDAPGVRVQIYKGGGMYALQEGRLQPQNGLTRGQLASTLMSRYGMAPDQAIEYVKHVDSYAANVFHATPHEPHPNMDALLRPEGVKMAMLMWDFIKKADAYSAADENVGPKANGPNRDTEQPGESGPNAESGAPPPKDKKPKDTAQQAAGNQGGQQAMAASAPGGAPPGAQPGAMGMLPPDPNAGAILPDIPFMKDVADLLTSYAMGAFAPDELGEIYNALIDKLKDVEDLASRVLTLVRFGKVDFVTENESKRLLDESDKFRSALINADMLLKGIAQAV